MISPSTIASGLSGRIATRVTSGCPPEWPTSTTLTKPEPTSSPTELCERPKKAIRPLDVLGVVVLLLLAQPPVFDKSTQLRLSSGRAFARLALFRIASFTAHFEK